MTPACHACGVEALDGCTMMDWAGLLRAWTDAWVAGRRANRARNSMMRHRKVWFAGKDLRVRDLRPHILRRLADSQFAYNAMRRELRHRRAAEMGLRRQVLSHGMFSAFWMREEEGLFVGECDACGNIGVLRGTCEGQTEDGDQEWAQYCVECI